ncbi:phage holin family protein [Erwinia sp. HR93]|uniref:phage holin family protein n=1 Tax=Erwinia sp. HR93 TaxID=3094840 RepID=UPI002ADEFA71|nr:phage holin family protein [Erwinia sp. HR93]MEA1062357.1 phage holin family protein [Erwinia sp. HR93]
MINIVNTQLLGYCLLASAWGGGVKFLQMMKRKGRQPLLLLFICQIMTSCFVGFIFFVFCQAESIAAMSTLSICALAGSIGDRVLSELWKRVGTLRNRIS